jgi:hypothetical protein
VLLPLVVPMIPFAFRIVVANDSFSFDDVGKGILERMRFILAFWDLLYFDLLHGAIRMVFFDMITQLCLHVGYDIP